VRIYDQGELLESSVYHGEYARFETASKGEGVQLLGSDNLVGDVYEIIFQSEGTQKQAWLKNRFGALVGYFDESISRQLSLYVAREWKIQAILSFVAYSEIPEPGLYWGEVALICFDAHASAYFDRYTSAIAARMANGVRPEIDLGEQGINRVFENKGAWSPAKSVPTVEKLPGGTVLKMRRSFKENLVEKARNKNKGCLIFSWAFLALIIVILVFALRFFGVLSF
jgi:hypothetical protein